MSRPRSQSRVRFSPDHLGPTPRGRPATAPRDPDHMPRERPYSPSRSRSRSRSRSHSRPRDSYDDHSPPRHRRHSPPTKDKHFYQKKTLWSGLATIATVAALLPTAVSAKASVDAAHASTRAARASERSAKQVTKSARASEVSARAAASSSIAQGHMDQYGRVLRKDSGLGGGSWSGGRQIGGYGGYGVRAENAGRVSTYGRAW